MALELTLEQGWRLEDAMKHNKKMSEHSGKRTLTPEKESKIVNLLRKKEVSQADIVRNEKVSHKTIINIRRKYKLWGA